MTWFRRFGPIYLPVSLAGWLVTLAGLAFMAQVFWAVDTRSHSLSDTLYAVYPFWGVTFLGWAYVAGRTSRP